MTSKLGTSLVAGWLACGLLSGGVARAAEAPAAEKALRFQPVQKDLQVDMPEAAEIAKCTVQGEKSGKTNGWVVRDSQGQVLRRFLDTNGDNFVDQWCYYRYGVEVYRDVDTNFNQKADQYRWLNTAGSRIGIDTNEDKKVDSWQNISAEEATAELVGAVRDKDPGRFACLLLADKELGALGLGKAKHDQLAKKLELAKANFATLVGQQKTITPDTKWVSFAGSQPGIVPAGTDESTGDILVYENVAAMIETDSKPQAINVGTLVRVAGGWRLIDAPQVSDEAVAEAEPKTFFFTPNRSERPETAVAGKPTDKAQKLMADLHALGDLTPNDPWSKYEERAAILEQLATDPESQMREAWYRQLADIYSAAVQTGNHKEGIEQLKTLEQKLKADEKDAELAFYIQFRWMTAEHNQALSLPETDFGKVQTKWIEDLEKFVEEAKKYPDTADAMLELAISQEFAGQEEQALKWYEAIVKEHPEAPIQRKAQGAKLRLSSVGQSIPLTGKLINGSAFDLAKLKGKVVVVQYWATWCEPCKADMPLLEKLRGKFKDQFEVVGVCLDNNKQEMTAFLRDNDPRWPQLFEEGGLESRFAVEMGIQTLPTMFLIDKQGKVVDRSIRAQSLQAEVMKLLK